MAKLHPGVGRLRVDLERGRHQPLRLAHLSRLRLGKPEQMQRVEIIGRGLEHARVKLLGFAQPALPLQAERLLQSLADVEAALRHDQGFWIQKLYMPANVSGNFVSTSCQRARSPIGQPFCANSAR